MLQRTARSICAPTCRSLHGALLQRALRLPRHPVNRSTHGLNATSPMLTPTRMAARSTHGLNAMSPMLIATPMAAQSGHPPAAISPMLIPTCMVAQSGTASPPPAASNDLTVKKVAISSVAAFGSGGMLGGMGVGGGIILISSLVNFSAFTQLQAIALSSGAQFGCALSAAGVWLSLGACNVPVAACLGCGGFAGVIVGVRIAAGLPDATLKLAFAGALCLIICPLSAYSGWKGEHSGPDELGDSSLTSESSAGEQCEVLSTKEAMMATITADALDLMQQPLLAARHVACGASAGLLFGALAIGDTPLMIAYLLACGFQQKTAIGTGLLASAPICAFTFAGHLWLGNAPAALAPVLMIAMGLGAAVGAKFCGSEISERTLKLSFAASVLMLGVVSARGGMASSMVR